MIIVITTRTARMIWTKVRPRTVVTEAMIVAIRIITALGIAIVVIAIRVTRPAGI